MPVILAGLATQVGTYFFDTPMVGAYISLGIAAVMAILLYLWCYTPWSTVVTFSREMDRIHVVYHLYGKRRVVRDEKISNVSDIKLKPQKGEGGIEGYWIIIEFKDTVKPIYLWHDRNE